MHHALRFLALLCLLAAGPALASPEQYKEWHDVCLAGDTDQIDAQILKYEAKLAANAKDQLARAYLGSACALRAKSSFWGPTKLKFLNRGRACLDDAVAGAPNDPRVRMVRAIGYFRVPKMFNMRSISIDDFKKIIPVTRDKKSDLKPNERQVILYYAHLAFSEEAEPGAAELKAECHRIAPDSYYGKLTK